MAIGAVLALISAAGPLAQSAALQVSFGISLLVLATGAALRRFGTGEIASSDSSIATLQEKIAALESLQYGLSEVQIECESEADMSQFYRAVNEATHLPLRQFLENRQALQDALGFGRFAELMMRFAAIERAINRTLSSSLDGVAEEARVCLQRSIVLTNDCLDWATTLQQEIESAS